MDNLYKQTIGGFGLIIAGLLVAAVMWYKLQMIEVLSAFVTAVLVPLAFFCAIGGVGGGSILVMREWVRHTFDEASRRVREKRERVPHPEVIDQ